MQFLIGIDGEDGGRDALALARALALPGDALALGLVAPGDRQAARASNLAYDARVREDGEALLARERDAAGVDAEVLVAQAPAVGEGLRLLGEEAQADIIVVGSSRRRALARLFGGDSARSTIRQAGRPVAVAPHGYAAEDHAIRRIGVGFDESEESLAALALARSLAAAHDATIDVVEAVEVASWLIDPAVAPALTQDTELRRQAAEERLAALPGVEAHATTGLSLQEMRQLACEVDALLVGWRPHGWIERLMEGSTGESLSHDPVCPVIAVPATPAERR